MLTFEEEEHVYRWNGKVMPSVTRIIEPLAGSLAGIPRDVLERKRQIGHALHLCVRLFHSPEGLDAATVDAAVQPYFDAYLEANAVHGFIWTVQEQPVGDPVAWIAGTPDAIGTSKQVDGQFVADWKTTAELSKVVGVQLAGYRRVLKRPTLRRFVLWLTPGSSTKYRFIEFKDADDDAAFAACLALHNWRSKRAA